MSASTEATIWSVSRPHGRSVSICSERGTSDVPCMTHPLRNPTLKMKLKLKATVPKSNVVQHRDELIRDHENVVFRALRLCNSQPSLRFDFGGIWNGNCG